MSKRHGILIVLCATFCSAFVSFSALPSGTDVWLFTYDFATGQHNIRSGVNISNNTGYDSQPSFSENGTYMLWTSERDSGQTDIFRYSTDGKVTTRFTQTKVSEYSPTFMYGGKYISAVVVEKDSTQRIWRYHKTSGKSELLLPKVYGVGYHCWLDEYTLFLFQITEPSTFAVCDVKSGTTKVITSGIGRCMAMYKTQKQKLMLYTQPDTEGKMWIKAVDKKGMKAPEFIPVPCLEGSEDYAVDNLRGYLLMGSGSKLYSWQIGVSTEWKIIADLSTMGISSISRLAVSPNGRHLALVDNSVK